MSIALSFKHIPLEENPEIINRPFGGLGVLSRVPGSVPTAETIIKKLVVLPKTKFLLASCILASSICISSLSFATLEWLGLISVAHPLFWLPIAIGTFGIAGSNYIYLRRTWLG